MARHCSPVDDNSKLLSDAISVAWRAKVTEVNIFLCWCSTCMHTYILYKIVVGIFLNMMNLTWTTGSWNIVKDSRTVPLNLMTQILKSHAVGTKQKGCGEKVWLPTAHDDVCIKYRALIGPADCRVCRYFKLCICGEYQLEGLPISPPNDFRSFLGCPCVQFMLQFCRDQPKQDWSCTTAWNRGWGSISIFIRCFCLNFQLSTSHRSVGQYWYKIPWVLSSLDIIIWYGSWCKP